MTTAPAAGSWYLTDDDTMALGKQSIYDDAELLRRLMVRVDICDKQWSEIGTPSPCSRVIVDKLWKITLGCKP